MHVNEAVEVLSIEIIATEAVDMRVNVTLSLSFDIVFKTYKVVQI
jgi:hypothetical protein